MSDYEILKNLIKPSACVSLEKNYGKFNVNLIEAKEKDSSVYLRDVPFDCVVIKTDKFPSPDKIFKCENFECKRSDYVLISEEKKCILYIEIKKTKDTNQDIIRQFYGAISVMAYIKTAGRLFFSDNFLNDYTSRYVAFTYARTICKRATTSDNFKRNHDKPENFYKVSNPSNVFYKHIVGL